MHLQGLRRLITLEVDEVLIGLFWEKFARMLPKHLIEKAR